MIMKTYLMYMYVHTFIKPLCTAPVHDFSTNNRSPFEVVNTCQPHRVHIVALQVKYLLCAKATTRECVGRVAEREKLLARKLPVLQYIKYPIISVNCELFYERLLYMSLSSIKCWLATFVFSYTQFYENHNEAHVKNRLVPTWCCAPPTVIFIKPVRNLTNTDPRTLFFIHQ